MESILTSIKKLLGITEECTDFDTDIIMHINSTFGVLTQLGVGPADGFMITDKTSTWSDFIPDKQLQMVKTYVYMKVRLLFDSNSLSSAAMEAAKQLISEFEWRLNVAAESNLKQEV